MEEYQDMEEEMDVYEDGEQPKHRQLVKMLTFRIVPAYFKEIKKVAKHKKVSISKLIRGYIKEGMVRDGELTKAQQTQFKI